MGNYYLAKLLCQYCQSYLFYREDKSRKCDTCGYTVNFNEEPNVLTLKELLSGNDLKDQPIEIQDNLNILLDKMNKVRVAYDKAMIVTSGLRSLDHHIQVYKDLAKQRKVPFDQSKVPMKSNHLFGRAVDIQDSDGKLYQWCQDNVKLLEEIGLWMEVADDQPRVHFQIVPPKSGNRFFNP
jgi:hypothetical protein